MARLVIKSSESDKAVILISPRKYARLWDPRTTYYHGKPRGWKDTIAPKELTTWQT